jgi:hypothetical protein
MKRLRRFLRLTTLKRRLFVKVFLLLELVRLGLWLLPFRTLLRLLSRVSEGPKKSSSTDRPSPEEIAWSVEVASRYSLGVKTCLTQALAAQVLLTRHGYPAFVHLGVLRGKQEEFQAHAWVESEGRVLVGGEDLERYAPLGILNQEPPTR